jgi:outer membrane receptor protein involved in Fe transport
VNGIINTVVTPPSNIAHQIEKGLDIEASYSVPLDSIIDRWSGAIDLRALATYVLELKSIDLQFGTVDGRGVLGAFGGAGPSGLTAPKFKAQVALSYTNDPVAVGVTMRHVASGVYNNAFIACTAACPSGNMTINDNHIDANTLFDLSLRYWFTGHKDTELFLTVQNLFNAPPPFIGGPLGGAYYAGQLNVQYDRLGRDFLTGIRFKM